MIIRGKDLPDMNDLIRDLKGQFSNYSVYTFDSKPEKSIVVRKSAIVGAQITVRDREIMIDACYPNLFISAVMSLLTFSTIFPFNSWQNFEKKITGFIKRKYS